MLVIAPLKLWLGIETKPVVYYLSVLCFCNCWEGLVISCRRRGRWVGTIFMIRKSLYIFAVVPQNCVLRTYSSSENFNLFAVGERKGYDGIFHGIFAVSRSQAQWKTPWIGTDDSGRILKVPRDPSGSENMHYVRFHFENLINASDSRGRHRTVSELCGFLRISLQPMPIRYIRAKIIIIILFAMVRRQAETKIYSVTAIASSLTFLPIASLFLLYS